MKKIKILNCDYSDGVMLGQIVEAEILKRGAVVLGSEFIARGLNDDPDEGFQASFSYFYYDKEFEICKH